MSALAHATSTNLVLASRCMPCGLPSPWETYIWEEFNISKGFPRAFLTKQTDFTDFKLLCFAARSDGYYDSSLNWIPDAEGVSARLLVEELLGPTSIQTLRRKFVIA